MLLLVLSPSPHYCLLTLVFCKVVAEVAVADSGGLLFLKLVRAECLSAHLRALLVVTLCKRTVKNVTPFKNLAYVSRTSTPDKEMCYTLSKLAPVAGPRLTSLRCRAIAWLHWLNNYITPPNTNICHMATHTAPQTRRTTSHTLSNAMRPAQASTTPQTYS